MLKTSMGRDIDTQRIGITVYYLPFTAFQEVEDNFKMDQNTDRKRQGYCKQLCLAIVCGMI